MDVLKSNGFNVSKTMGELRGTLSVKAISRVSCKLREESGDQMSQIKDLKITFEKEHYFLIRRFVSGRPFGSDFL